MREVNVRSPGETVDVDVVEVAMESAEMGVGVRASFFYYSVFISHNTKQDETEKNKPKKSTERSRKKKEGSSRVYLFIVFDSK